MARVIFALRCAWRSDAPLRAPACLAFAVLAALGPRFHSAAVAQQPVMYGSPPAPAGQPMWISQPPTYQVGPNGAVNLDQPMMPFGAQYAPPTMTPGASPMMLPPGTAPAYWAGPDCASQPCPTPTGLMVPQQVPCPPAVVQPPPPPPLRWMVFGEVLWLHPTGVDMAHAQQQDGIGGAGTVPFGTIGVVDPSYDIGFRLGGELQVTPCSGVFVSYAFFDTTEESSVVPPAAVGGGLGAVGSLVHHPGAAITASVGPVDATYDIEFQLGDAAYRQILYRDCVHSLSSFVGARFAQLEQRFLQQGEFAGGAAGTIQTTTNIEFTGAGPMAGLDSMHKLGETGFSVYGRALVAAITGSFESHYRMLNTTTDVLLAESIWEDDRIVPMLEYELGIAWTSPRSRVRLAAGYMMSHWFNVVTTPVLVDAVQADNYVDVGDTISFDGLVGRAELRF